MIQTIPSQYIEAAEELFSVGSSIKLLSDLSWPAQEHDRFLAAWRRDEAVLPRPEYRRVELSDAIGRLKALRAGLDRSHPIARYLDDTAQSYVAACRLLENVGSPRITPYSIELFGRPGDAIAGGRVHNIDAARHFLNASAEYRRECRLTADDYCLSAATLETELTSRLQQVFAADEVRVVLDPTLVSKAAAGATRIRLRDGACFSEYDIEQLLQHEAFVHSLTALNGRRQPALKTLSLGAPRTTATQEGLATFAELITGAIDIGRIERIAMRIIAIEMALTGADFIDVFRYFLEAGQNESESFYSAMRVFRGAPTTGGSAFTKDTVYLHGLMQVHTFFRWCLNHQCLGLTRWLFAGRMSIADVMRLEPFFADGTLASPEYLPPWMAKSNTLSAYLAFSVFSNRIPIDDLGKEYLFDEAEDLGR